MNEFIRKKQFKEALIFGGDVLKINPNSFEVINLCGVANSRLGEYDKAADKFREAIAKNPKFIRAYINLAFATEKLDTNKEAIKVLKTGLKNNPNDNSLKYYLGSFFLKEGEFGGARKLLWQCIFSNPTDWEAMYKLGNMYEKIKRYDLAIAMYKKGARLKVELPLIYIKIADLYKRNGSFSKAILFYKKTLKNTPVKNTILQHVATNLYEIGEIKISKNLFEKLLSSSDKNAEIIINLSNIYQKENKLNDALKLLEYGKEKYPLNEIIAFNLGNMYKAKGFFLEAIKQFQTAVDIKKGFFQAYSNLGATYNNVGDYERGLGNLNKALSINKKINVARFSTLINIGVTFLTLGKFKEGWEKYEYRWKVDPGDKVVWPLKGKSLWEGETKRRVLLWREQGIGDDIIFLGLVQEANDAAGEGMSVVIDPRLVSICERSMPGIEFVPFSTQRINEDQFDCHLPMGSLPRLFRTSEEDFKRTKKSYLKADMDKVENLRRELGVEGKSVIGISWKSFKSLNTSKKSMDLDQFGRIFKACNAVLLNLQYGDVDEEIREFKKNTGIEVLQCSSINLKEDLDGLASLIELCDLVVSTSSVTIHMAGALGKDSWVLLPFAANFWWLIERTDSLWYPTVRLYRQKSLQDWSEVLELITSDLNQRFDKQ